MNYSTSLFTGIIVTCVCLLIQYSCTPGTKTNNPALIKAHLAKGKALFQIDRKKAKEHASTALELSRKTNDTNLAVNSLICLADVTRLSEPIDTLLSIDKQAIELANKTNNRQLKFTALLNYTKDLTSFNYLPQAQNALEAAGELADTNSVTRMQLYNAEGLYYFKQKVLDKADSCYLKSLNIAQSLQDSEAIVLNNFARFRVSIYKGERDFDLTHALEAIQYFETHHQPELAATAKHAIGEAYQFVGNFKKAFEMFEQAYPVFANNSNHFQAAAVKLQCSESYKMRGIFQDALPFLLDVKKRFDTLQYPLGQAMVLNQLGSYYSTINDFEQADKYLDSAAALANDLNYPPLQGMNALMRAQNLERQKKFGAADKAALKSMSYIDQMVSKELKHNLYTTNNKQSKVDIIEQRLLNDSNFRLKHGEQALHTWRAQNKKSGDTAFWTTSLLSGFDSAVAASYNTQLLTLETQYKTRQKEDSLRLERQSNLIAQQSLKMNNLYLLGALMITVVLATGLWFQYKNRKRAERDKAKIQLLQNEIHHRVKNNLGVISRLVEVAGKNAVDEIPLSSLKNRIKAIELLHKNLYSENTNAGNVSLQNYLEDLCSSIANTINTGKAITIRIDAKAEVVSDVAEKLGLIINELVTNSYKYAFTDQQSGEIDIKAQMIDNDQLQVSVCDNGSGFEAGKNGNYGMKLIKGLSNELRGQFEFISSMGTRFNLLVPVVA